jgi:hypothetical protein
VEQDGLAKAGVTLTMTRETGKANTSEKIGVTRQAGDSPYFSCEAPRYLLQTFYCAQQKHASGPLEIFLLQPRNALAWKTDQLDGNKVVRIDLSIPRTRGDDKRRDFELWLDPKVNHLARKLITRTEGNDGSRTVLEVLKFDEPVPGVFFPVVSKLIAYQDNKPEVTIDIEVSDLRVNQPIADSVFTLEIPAGAFVADEISGTSYTMVAGGGKTDVQNRPRMDVAAIGIQSDPNAPKPTPWQEAHPETLTSGLWYIAAAFFVLLAVGTLWLRRRSNRIVSGGS